MATPVPAGNYPYLRYCRVAGDWEGVDETRQTDLASLANLCRNLCAFLSVHGRTFGVKL